MDNLSEQEKELKTALKEITASMNATVNHLGSVVSEQGVINKFNINLLDNLNRKMEEQEKRLQDHTKLLNDHSILISMIKEMLKVGPARTE